MLYLGDLEQFVAAIPASGPYHSYYHGFVHLLNGDLSTARHNLNQAFTDFPSDMFGSLSRALLAHLVDDDRLAIEMVRQVASGRERLPLRDGEVSYKQAQLLALAGDNLEALATLEQTIDQGFFCSICFLSDPALRGIQDNPRFEQLMERATARQRAFGLQFGLPIEVGTAGLH